MLEVLLNRIESRSDRRGSNTRYGVIALLGLALILALHHPSAILHHKGLVHHPLEFLKVTCFLGISETVIQTVEEARRCPLRWSIARKPCEMSDILAHGHESLLQIIELILQFDYPLGYMLRAKCSIEFLTVDALCLFKGFNIGIPPISRRSHKLVRS
jgi:hypothetical protein